jgi:hypothetical protein
MSAITQLRVAARRTHEGENGRAAILDAGHHEVRAAGARVPHHSPESTRGDTAGVFADIELARARPSPARATARRPRQAGLRAFSW